MSNDPSQPFPEDQGTMPPQKIDSDEQKEAAKKELERELERELTPEQVKEALEKARERQGEDPFSHDN